MGFTVGGHGQEQGGTQYEQPILRRTHVRNDDIHEEG